MSRRYWLPLIAVVGLLGSVQAQPVRQSPSGQAAAQQRKTKPAADAPPSIPVTVQNDIHGIASALKTANDKQPSSTDERNAKAQEDVAWWTPWLLLVAFLEMLVTGAGVWLVYRTLYHTKRAADAAHATVQSMESTSARQLRAYVHVWRCTMSISEGAAHVRVRLENAGSTPAYKASGYATVWVDTFPTPQNIPTTKPKLGTDIGPGGKMTMWRRTPISDAEMKRVTEGTHVIWVTGILDYQDAFKQPRHVDFRYFLAGYEVPKAMTEKVRLSLCEQGNNSD